MAESGEIENKTVNKDGSYKAVLIGATGAVGKHLFAELVKDKKFQTITVIGRKPASIPEDFPKVSDINLQEEEQSGRVLQVNDVDMNGEINKETVGKHFEGKDVFFSCFGTSKKQAGSTDEFRRIDFGINHNMAKVAKECNVPFYSLVSSQGADSKSFFLYMKCKGELDEKTTELNFDKISIWRPGMLERGTDKRILEKAAGLFLRMMPIKYVAYALYSDALNRLSAAEGEESKGRKIYSNVDIYRFCGLNKNGKPVKEWLN